MPNGDSGWARLQVKYTRCGAPPVAAAGDDEFAWNGTYGWYDDGWDGPGWYIVGYEFRHGLGFGGREDWHGWRHHSSHSHQGGERHGAGHVGGGPASRGTVAQRSAADTSEAAARFTSPPVVRVAAVRFISRAMVVEVTAGARTAQGDYLVSDRSVVGSLVALGILAVGVPAAAQTKPAAADVPGAPSEPVQSSLTVGALQIASAANLEIAGFDIRVAGDSVVYSYFLKNTGTKALALAATVSLPELQASADRSETWKLAAGDPENPVGLTIAAAGAPVATKAEVHAYALGVDRLAEIKAEHLPLIPFGTEVDKALSGLSPDAAGRLAASGVISPRDPAQPQAPPIADWSLDVVRSWRQELPPGKTTPIIVKFTPVKSQFRIGKGNQQDLDDLKDDACLRPPILGALQSRLKSGGAWIVSEFPLAADAPARWVDSPSPTVSVQKPTAEAIVAFCGMDEKTANKPIVLGVAPGDSDEILLLIFEPAAK